jgi:hypothetical protein
MWLLRLRTFLFIFAPRKQSAETFCVILRKVSSIELAQRGPRSAVGLLSYKYNSTLWGLLLFLLRLWLGWRSFRWFRCGFGCSLLLWFGSRFRLWCRSGWLSHGHRLCLRYWRRLRRWRRCGLVGAGGGVGLVSSVVTGFVGVSGTGFVSGVATGLAGGTGADFISGFGSGLATDSVFVVAVLAAATVAGGA